MQRRRLIETSMVKKAQKYKFSKHVPQAARTDFWEHIFMLQKKRDAGFITTHPFLKILRLITE
jgi:parvulin-like peptidyl-prolyl isomerase